MAELSAFVAFDALHPFLRVAIPSLLGLSLGFALVSLLGLEFVALCCGMCSCPMVFTVFLVPVHRG